MTITPRPPDLLDAIAARADDRSGRAIALAIGTLVGKKVAEHDPAMVVRGRALSLLRDTTPETRGLVASILASPDSHPILLCGALEASRAFAGDPEMAAQRDALLDHADPRVRHAAQAR